MSEAISGFRSCRFPHVALPMRATRFAFNASDYTSVTRHIRLHPFIKPSHRMRPGKIKPLPNRLDKRRGREHRMAKLLGQVLQPRGFVDGAADHREVEPLVGA